MKRLFVCFLCIIMFMQNGVGIYAAELYSESITISENAEPKENIEDDLVQKVEQTTKEDVAGELTEKDVGKLVDEIEKELAEEIKEESEDEIVEEESEIFKEKATDKKEVVLTEELMFNHSEKMNDVLLAVETGEAYDDPQYGRENGFEDYDFYELQAFSSENEDYVHNSKFANYIIEEVIDVSSYQGEINWSQVKKSGINYAIIRVGYRGYETGKLKTDIAFKKNIEQAISSGIKVGVYFCSQAINEEEAKEEAEYVLNNISGYDIELPVAIDFEYASTSKGLTGRLYNANLSVEMGTQICKKFCSIIENEKYTAMVYANKSMLQNGLNATDIAEEYKIWLANYTTCTSYSGDYEFWQYTKSATVDGILENVDKSFWYKEQTNAYVQVEEGIYTIETCLNAEVVLDIPNATVNSGAVVQIYSDNGTWAQKFYVRQETDGAYIIMSANSGKVLEVKNSIFNNGSEICQANYTGAENQKWRFKLNSDQSYSIESVVLDMVMDIRYGSSLNGTKVQLYEYNGSEAQKFCLNIEEDESVRSLENGIYCIETALGENKNLTINVNNSKLEIQNYKGKKIQKFELNYIGKGCYRLVSVASDELLTAGKESEVLLQREKNVDLQQKWILKKINNNTYSFISAFDGRVLDVMYASVAEGTKIQKYESNGTKAQQFKVYTTSAEEEKLEEGIYIIHSALDDQKVLDVAYASTKADANIQLYAFNGTKAQQFVIKKLEDESYRITSYSSGMAVSVEENRNINGANIFQYFPTDLTSQRWEILPTGNGYYEVITALGDKVIDIACASTANGANIQLYTSNGSKAQKFRFEKIGEISEAVEENNSVEDGTYIICSSLDEGKLIDISGASLYTGANVQLYTSNATAAQQFIIQRNKDSDLYTIISKKSGLKITYTDGLFCNGTNVYQGTTVDAKGNYWKLTHVVGDYYMIYAGDSDYCWDVQYASVKNGANIQIYKGNNSKAQIFKLKKINTQVLTEQKSNNELEEGVYKISSFLNEAMLLDVANASNNNGAKIQLYKDNNTNAQKFVVRKLKDGNYTLTCLASNKMVTVQNGGVTNGTNVCQNEDQKTLSQQWQIVPAGNGYYTLLSAKNGKALDIANASTFNGANIQIYTSNYTAAQRFKFIEVNGNAKAEIVKNSDEQLGISYRALVKKNINSVDNMYYLFKMDSQGKKMQDTPLAYSEKNFEIIINLMSLRKNEIKELLASPLVLAVKKNDGSYMAINESISICNPEVLASNTSTIFQGTSKKGLQGITYASYNGGSDIVDARNANTKHTLLNLDLSKVVSKTPKSGYRAYTYKENTYYFSELTDLKTNIRSLNAGYQQYLYGNNETTKVAVSLCLLLSYGYDTSYLIDPAARTPGYSYYMLNVREEEAREIFEALFLYLGETFGQENCYVSNWILGNEINSSKAWNYSGSLDFDTYMECYATAFRLLYNGVKSTKTGNTVSISLDNGWIAAPDTYAGKTTLDIFAKKIHEQNPNIEWSIAYHPYSYPLTRVDFWNDYSNTTDSLSTRYISMRNINVLTNYVATLENTYGLPIGSIRVLLTEQGYSYSGGDKNQALAIARGYYIAEFNNRIDAFIIRAVVDDPDEAQGKLYFGLMNRLHEKRIAFYVYEHMDSDIDQFKNISPIGYVSPENYDKFNKAKEIICNTNWSSIVPGFNKTKLANIR